MFGFLGHTTNPRTGRPEPQPSWPGQRILTLTAWGGSVSLLAGAFVHAFEPSSLAHAMELLGAAVLIFLIAYARHIALERKKREFREALAAYEAASGETDSGNP